MTKIIKCTCVHEYQDQKYGKFNREMNLCEGGYRCTVCGKEPGDKSAHRATVVSESEVR
jgi:hypothetical protein